MSVGPDKLVEILNEVQNYFNSHSTISVTPLEGNPPEKYEITYNSNGLTRDSQGKIVESTEHIVEITIPFGFPHFPPSCKPKTDIFHPDFDPAAICLGDFWNQECQLSDLIVHIEKMLIGEIYSTTNAFNEDAAIWYTTHSDRLPLWSIALDEEAEPATAPDTKGFEIDTLEDSDLVSDFNFLTLEETAPDDPPSLVSSISDSESDFDIDIELVHFLVNQKKYYKLLDTTKDNAELLANIREISQQAKHEIKKAEKLYQNATELEQLGNNQKALDTYENVLDAVTDFPNISEDIKRVKKSLTPFGDLSPDFEQLGEKTISITPPPAAAIPPPKKRRSEAVKKSSSSIQSPEQTQAIRKESGPKNRLPLYLALSIVLLTSITSGYFYYSSERRFSSAEQSFLACSSFFQENELLSAKKSCNAALENIRKVRFVKQENVAELQASILEILQSERISQVLAGNVLFEGNYIPKKELKALQKIQSSIEEANTLFQQEKWQQSIDIYTNVLPLTEKNSHIAPSITEEIRQKIELIRFKTVYQEAKTDLDNGEWDKATSKLGEAQAFLEKIKGPEKLEYSKQIKSSLLKSRFEAQKAQGDHYFSMSDWQQAKAFYNQALATIQGTDLLPAKTTDSIAQNTSKAELYATIARGNKAFKSGEWDKAIEAYSYGSTLLANNSNLLTQGDSANTRKKLNKIRQQTSIIRDRQMAIFLETEQDYTNARKKYQQIISTIENSSFSEEKEFAETKAEITSVLGSLEARIFFEEKEQYLKDNFQPLFASIYTTSTPGELSNPLISLDKEVGEQVIFRMQCTEAGGGRPLTLVMYYAFDKKSGTWGFYSNAN